MQRISFACFLASIATALLPASAHAAWSQAKSPHFTVYSDGSVKQLQTFAEDLEKFDALLRLATGASGPDNSAPVRVFLVRSAERVQKLVDAKNIGGFYSVGRRNGYAILSRAEQGFGADAQVILFHEYTHHFMLHYFPAAYPAWYVEGFAEYYSTATFAKGKDVSLGKIPLARAPTLLRLPLYSVKDLFTTRPLGLPREEMARFYGTAWLLTHYLRANPARGAEFNRYLVDLANGKPDMNAETYFTGGFAALDKELRTYKNGKLSYMMINMPQVKVDVTVSALPPAENALIEDEMQLLRGVDKEDRERFATDVRTATAAFPQSAYAFALLGDAEYIADHQEAAAEAADKAIAIDPKNARALSTRAAVQLERAQKSDKPEDWKAALGFIVRANRADPEDPVPLEQYYRYFRMHREKPPEIAYDGLWKALALLPQSPNIRFQLATALANNRDFERAANLLTPIALSPHESPMQQSALRLRGEFLAAKDGKAPGEAASVTAAQDGGDDGKE